VAERRGRARGSGLLFGGSRNSLSGGKLGAGGAAESGAQPARQSFAIGIITHLVGSASVLRANGNVIRLKLGDHVFRDDVIETTADGQVCVCFVDNTTVSLSNNARMVLAQFPGGGNSRKALLDVTRGDFSFCGGTIARTGQLEIATPFANIRGRYGARGIGTLSLVSLFLAMIEDAGASPPDAARWDNDDRIAPSRSSPRKACRGISSSTIPA
jgi:hypothetical protein